MTKLHSLALVLLAGLLAVGLPACGGSKKNPFGKRSTGEQTDLRNVGAVEGPVQERKFAEPTATQTLYLLYLRDKQNRPVQGVSAMVLVQPPEGLNINQPRRKTVVAEMPSGRDGIAPIMSEADGKPKWAWVGGKSVFPPAVYELQPAVGGQTVKMTLQVPIQPVAKLVFTDHTGMRVPNGIITFKPLDGAGSDVENIGDRPGGSDNYGSTKRSNGLGEIEYPRPAGRYALIATKENGSSRLYAIVNWNGDESKPLEFTLPETSMTEAERPW
ncbi:MAG: hypothetical protein CMJ94_11125 [Planctomycetes bacterium]|nr:hypothetical protein [Planctomycetota bacterium]